MRDYLQSWLILNRFFIWYFSLLFEVLIGCIGIGILVSTNQRLCIIATSCSISTSGSQVFNRKLFKLSMHWLSWVVVTLDFLRNSRHLLWWYYLHIIVVVECWLVLSVNLKSVLITDKLLGILMRTLLHNDLFPRINNRHRLGCMFDRLGSAKIGLEHHVSFMIRLILLRGVRSWSDFWRLF
jgi:hypothetical protein